MIQFSCPTCRNRMQAPHEACGTKVHCPACGQRIQVPASPSPQAMVDPAMPAAPPPSVPQEAAVFAQPTGGFNPLAFLVAAGIGGFLLVGLCCAVYILLSTNRKSETGTAPAQAAPRAEVERLTPRRPIVIGGADSRDGRPATPEKFLLSELEGRFRRNRASVRRLTGKWLTIDMEDRTWEVEDLKPGPDGNIQLVASHKNVFSGEQRIQMVIRFSQSRDKLISRMQQYAESRNRGEIVRLTVTGKLDIERHRGQEFLALNDVSLE